MQPEVERDRTPRPTRSRPAGWRVDAAAPLAWGREPVREKHRTPRPPAGLAEGIASGDVAAEALLVDRYYDRVFGMILARTCDQQVASLDGYRLAAVGTWAFWTALEGRPFGFEEVAESESPAGLAGTGGSRSAAR